MTNDELKTMFTCGGCGILAQEILKLAPEGQPVLWKDKEGYPVHAAVLVDGRLLHFGDRETGYVTCTEEELANAVECDFDPRIGTDECRELAREMAEKIVGEL